jgi:RNA polymerase sigma factor (sigma-70 family)
MTPVQFTSLYREHFLEVFRLAKYLTYNTEQAKDLTQAVFANVWIKQDRLPAVENMTGYLLISTRNLARDMAEKKETRRRRETDFYFRRGEVERPDDTNVLKRALRSLNPFQRRVFVLKYMHGMKPGEIAERVGIEVYRVYVCIQEVKSKFIKALSL